MSWGWRIFTIYVVFVLLILGMVFFAMRQNVDLVAKDYYKQEIEYQTTIDKLKNARDLPQPLLVQHDDTKDQLMVVFPANISANGVQGQIHFYKPDNATLDWSEAVQPDAQGRQAIDLKKMAAGRWKVSIDWRANGNDYLTEETLELTD
jgi:hypothetical protein